MTCPIMFFAAGLGTRMGALTRDIPKPLVKVAGRALLDHAMDPARAANVGPMVVNVHYRAEQIRSHLSGQEVRFSDETDALLETGGGLRKALPLLGSDPVLTMNTDAVWNGPNPIAAIMSAWTQDMETLLLLVPRDRAFGHTGKGDFLRDNNGRLSRGPNLIYTGLQMTRTGRLDAVPEPAFSMNRVWDMAASDSGLFGVVYPGLWCDVGRPDGIETAERMLARDV